MARTGLVGPARRAVGGGRGPTLRLSGLESCVEAKLEIGGGRELVAELESISSASTHYAIGCSAV